AANSLLKTLEEPPEGTFFFLIAPSMAGVMPTLRSRSRTVQFKPLTEEGLSRRVKAPAWALRSARGSFEKLSQLQEGPELEVRKKALDILQLLFRDQDFLLNETWRAEFKDRQQGQQVLAYWTSFLKDVVCLQESATDQVVNMDQMKFLQDLTEYRREFLLDLMQKTLRAEQALVSNRDPQLVVEELYVTSFRSQE
ncbi:MAG: DNA polymerase III subunit delta', partial [Bdellovibrio sp.]